MLVLAMVVWVLVGCVGVGVGSVDVGVDGVGVGVGGVGGCWWCWMLAWVVGVLIWWWGYW